MTDKRKEPTIVQQHAENFETLKNAFARMEVALMECQEVATREKVAVICVVQRTEDGNFDMIPFARFFNGNPYELLQPPNPDGGFFDEEGQIQKDG